MSLLDDLKKESEGWSDKEKSEMAEFLGLKPAEPEVDIGEVSEDSVCLQCGLLAKYNTQSAHPLAARDDDGKVSGWGSSEAPIGVTFCKRCKSRTQWGKRTPGMRLPGDPADPSLQGDCQCNQGMMRRLAISVKRSAEGYVMGPDGQMHPRFRERAGRPQFECRNCAQRFHGKRNEETELGWIPDMGRPIEEVVYPGHHVRAIEAFGTPVPQQLADPSEPVEDPDLVAEREQADETAKLRREYEIPMEAFDIRWHGVDVMFTVLSEGGERTIFRAGKRDPDESMTVEEYRAEVRRLKNELATLESRGSTEEPR